MDPTIIGKNCGFHLAAPVQLRTADGISLDIHLHIYIGYISLQVALQGLVTHMTSISSMIFSFLEFQGFKVP